MRSLSGIFPEHSGSVDFYAVNVDPSTSLDEAAGYGQNQDWTFPVAKPDDGMIRNFNIVKHSVKVAFGGDGVIVYRDGFGKGNAGTWTQVFQNLSGS
ncbi:MAG: hypothetical protein J4G14_11745 [Dehalococcoidia bacterium]|nr:hypothetical protein [Dehalococcoidia bacterium]